MYHVYKILTRILSWSGILQKTLRATNPTIFINIVKRLIFNQKPVVVGFWKPNAKEFCIIGNSFSSSSIFAAWKSKFYVNLRHEILEFRWAWGRTKKVRWRQVNRIWLLICSGFINIKIIKLNPKAEGVK